MSLAKSVAICYKIQGRVIGMLNRWIFSEKYGGKLSVALVLLMLSISYRQLYLHKNWLNKTITKWM